MSENSPIPQATLDAITALQDVLPGRVHTDLEIRHRHCSRWTWLDAQCPDVVVEPETLSELRQIIQIARRYRVAIIPFGGGSSVEGHVNAPFGGISIDMKRFNKIGPLNQKDASLRVGAGVPLSKLNEHLADTDFFFSVDPGAGEATIGGMAATRASGSNTVRYGTMKDNVISLEVMLSTGELIETATQAPKSAAGYDLTALFIGSEGTLGLISAVTLKLHPRPEATVTAVAGFETLHNACTAVIDLIHNRGIKPSRIELLDPLMLHAINAQNLSSFHECPTLFVEFQGHGGEPLSQFEVFQTLTKQSGATGLDKLTSTDEQKNLWSMRHGAFRALQAAWPGKDTLATDVCVPVSRLAEAIEDAHARIEHLRLVAPIVGHVGDGNFHVLPMFDRTDTRDREAIDTLLNGLIDTALKLGGTCTGEHGIGQGKIKFLKRQAGAAVEVMAVIKRALDPDNIFNPGKIMPGTVSRLSQDEH